MTFRETFYQVKRLMESRLHDFGLESANADTMGWTTMLSIKQNTRVTIDAPLILIYSDEFLISGTLETSTYSRLNGKTVKLKVGNTIVATTTTNINGEYSFTHTPMSTGNHSFQVIFEGTNIYSASQSSVVNRTVDKETSVMNLNGISTQHYGDTVIFGGQLLDDDGQYISNASVKYYLNNSLVTALTTDAQGRFSTSKSVDSFSTQNVKFIYDGDNNYTNCEGSNQINVSQPQLSLTSDKDILSYADNEYATLTATLTENINNIPVSFMAYKLDNSLFSKLEFDLSTNNEYEDATFAIDGDIIEVDFSNISDYAALILQSKDNNLLMFEYSDNNISIMEHLETSNAEDEYINIDGNVATIDLSNNLLNAEYELRDEYNILYGPYVKSSGDNLVVKSNAELIDTVNTNEDGIASVLYYGKGAGDLCIQASISNTESNIVNIEDVIKYKFTNLNLTKTDDRTLNATLEDNNLVATSGSLRGALINNVFQYDGDYEVSFKVSETNPVYDAGVRIAIQSMSLYPTSEALYESQQYSIAYENTNTKLEFTDSPILSTSKYSSNWSIGSLIQFKIIGNTITAYCDGVRIFQRTGTWLHDTMRIVCHGWGQNTSEYIGITDFKVKPLENEIILSSDKNILSYSDNDYAIISAQLTKPDGQISGESVSFEIHKSSDDSLIETLTSTTNSNGVATINYYANGAGDIYVKAICNNINSNHVNIEDCQKYDPTSHTISSSSDKFTTGTAITVTGDFKLSYITQLPTSMNEFGLGVSNQELNNQSMPSTCNASFVTITSLSNMALRSRVNGNYKYEKGTSNFTSIANKTVLVEYILTNGNNIDCIIYDANTGDVLAELNDATFSHTISPRLACVLAQNGTSITYSDFKIKPLIV